MNKKRRIYTTFSVVNLSDFDEAVKVFEKAKSAKEDRNSPEGWKDFKICYAIYDDILDEFSIEGSRWETDQEYERRLTEEKKNKESARKHNKTLKAEKEKYEREMYEKLKKKYGDK